MLAGAVHLQPPGSDVVKRSPIKRKPTKIRTLQPGESLPEGQPRRYKNGAGYVRLRWKVGPNEYVETYEHRLVMGLPPRDVHHRDGDKTNNDPTNLVPLDRSKHAQHHAEVSAATSNRETVWGGYRSQYAFDKAQRAAQRREDRKRFLAEVAALYESGLSTVEIGDRVGRHAATVSIALRASGKVARRRAGRNTDISNGVRQLVHARAAMRCEACGRNVSWGGRQVHHRRPRQMGGSRRADTNMPANLLLLCTDCHNGVESHRADAYNRGLLLRTDDSPSLVAVEHAVHGWVYLLDDGSVSTDPPVS